MFQIEKPLSKAEGSFYVEKVNVKTGEYTRGNRQKNLLTDNFYKAMALAPGGTFSTVFEDLYLGKGTAEPSASDTALGNKTWSVEQTTGTAEIAEDLLSVSITAKFVVPASSDYVGNITEVGLRSSAGLVTHSLIKDAEGHAYTIEKTDLDEITFVYTITVTLNDNKKIFINPLRMVHYCRTIGGRYYDFDGLANPGSLSGMPFGLLTPFKNIMWKGRLIARFGRVHKCWTYTNYGQYTENTVPFAYYADYIPSECTYNNNTKTLTVPRRRFTASNKLNGHYINGICPTGYADNAGPIILYFPNEEVMPKTVLSGCSIGVGDGATKEFTPSLQYWVKDTEKVYVDGVLKTRGTDYTCDNIHNSSNLFELLPSSHMMIIEGSSSGALWFNLTSDIRGSSDLPEETFSTSYNRKDLGTGEGAKLNINKTGDTVFYMFGEEDLSLDQTVTEVYMSTGRNASRNTFSLSYSDDGEVFTPLLTDIEPDEKYMKSYNLSEFTKHVVKPVKAKYWKLSINNTDSSYLVEYVGLVMRNTPGKLTFKEAPSSGAVITMDATIDRPYKDDKHVVDIVGTIQL